MNVVKARKLKTYIISHHSQTQNIHSNHMGKLKTDIISHHSQTVGLVSSNAALLKTYIISHHSQTSNSKMKMPSHIKQYSS